MSHKTRAEQYEVKARKDPNGLARKTKVHTPKTVYKRVRKSALEDVRYELNTRT